LKRYSVPEPAELPNRRVRVCREIVPDLSALVDDDIWVNYGVLPDADPRSHNREGSNRRILADAGGNVHKGERMDARLRARRLIKQRERSGEIEVRIARNDAGYAAFDRRGGQNGSCPAVFYFGSVFRVGKKGNVFRPRLFHAADAANLAFAVPADLTPELPGQLIYRHQSSLRGKHLSNRQSHYGIVRAAPLHNLLKFAYGWNFTFRS
jgi:hypothetical protein